MRASSCLFAAVVSSLSCLACSPALAQTKVAAAEISSSPKPTIPALTAPAGTDATPLPPELIAVATPTFDLGKYAIPKERPTLDCPAGTKEVGSSSAAGWEVHCARGDDRHGPFRSFDRTALREVRATYDSGKQHGVHVEVRMTPALSSYSSDKPAGSLAAEAARAALGAGWPFAMPADPVCPSGTTLRKALDSAMCLLPGGVAHGPQWSSSSGIARFQIWSIGSELLGTATLDDMRTARESTYEKGQLTRVLEHGRGGRVYLEVHKGEDAATVYFHPQGPQLVRTRRGKQHGVQLGWDGEGRLSLMRTYVDGAERGEAAQWSGGTLVELRNVVDGRGTVERFHDKNRHRCQMEAHQRRVCESIEDEKVLAREVYEDGRMRGVVRLWPSGAKFSEARLSIEGEIVEEKQWKEDGRLERELSCDEKTCTTTTWDVAGVATKGARPRSSPGAGTPDPLAGPMNAIRELVGGSPAKPAAKVAVP
jgi:hypothetical protein